MAIITTFTSKGSAVTYAEIDANFNNLNDELVIASSDIDTMQTDLNIAESILANATPLATAGTLVVRDAEGDATVRELGVTTIRFFDGTSLSSKAETGVESGTRMTFNQTAAPLGWTKDTTIGLNDSIMRIVTGTVSSGGTTAFSTFNGQTSVGATTLTINQIPSHSHTIQRGSGSTGQPVDFVAGQVSASAVNTSSVGGGQSHTHTVTTNIKYNDFIIASKD